MKHCCQGRRWSTLWGLCHEGGKWQLLPILPLFLVSFLFYVSLFFSISICLIHPFFLPLRVMSDNIADNALSFQSHFFFSIPSLSLFHQHCCPHSAVCWPWGVRWQLSLSLFLFYVYACTANQVFRYSKCATNRHGFRHHAAGLLTSIMRFLLVEKHSTALWIRALLPKQHCQHTNTRCWAHMTQKTTSLSAKQVEWLGVLSRGGCFLVSIILQLLNSDSHHLSGES